MSERKNDMRGDVKFACLDSLVPANHLLRKIDSVVDFIQVYGMVEHLYRDDFGRPAVDTVVLVKRARVCRCLRETCMRYTLHRGLDRVRNWVKLKFAAMNLKKLALWG